MPTSALDVAKYLLSLVDAERGQVISNLALQKLLYYCQGYYSAYTKGKPLFEDEIVAWDYGPVVKKVYSEYRKYGNHSITKENIAEPIGGINEEQKFVIEMVFDFFKKISAIELMNLSHEEDTYKTTKKNDVISFDKIKKSFQNNIEFLSRDLDFDKIKNDETRKAILNSYNSKNRKTFKSVKDMWDNMNIKIV
jgi:uncharacterized phage-associated protein